MFAQKLWYSGGWGRNCRCFTGSHSNVRVCLKFILKDVVGSQKTRRFTLMFWRPVKTFRLVHLSNPRVPPLIHPSAISNVPWIFDQAAGARRRPMLCTGSRPRIFIYLMWIQIKLHIYKGFSNTSLYIILDVLFPSPKRTQSVYPCFIQSWIHLLLTLNITLVLDLQIVPVLWHQFHFCSF